MKILTIAFTLLCILYSADTVILGVGKYVRAQHTGKIYTMKVRTLEQRDPVTVQFTYYMKPYPSKYRVYANLNKCKFIHANGQVIENGGLLKFYSSRDYQEFKFYLSTEEDDDLLELQDFEISPDNSNLIDSLLSLDCRSYPDFYVHLVGDGYAKAVIKMILVAKSQYANRVFQPDFYAKREDNVIDVSNFNQQTVELTVEALYYSRIPETLTIDELSDLLEFTDYFLIPSIMKMVFHALLSKVNVHNHWKIYLIVSKYAGVGVSDEADDRGASMAKTFLQEYFLTNYDEIKKVSIEKMRKHMIEWTINDD